jgi:hypothetical protein
MSGIQKSFVVKNGLEVNTDLIFADANKNQVGIATTNPKYTLHVNGGIGATSLIVTGIATFPQLVLSGTLSASGTSGTTGQYLKSTGTGVSWEDFPVGRTATTFVAAPGQTIFNFAYSVGLVDVFINGVKLTPTEFTATDAVTVVLVDACFGGEVVDIHGYSVRGLGAGTTGITGLTVQDEGVIIGNPQGVTSLNIVGASLTSTGTGAGVTISIIEQWTTTDVGVHTLSNVGLGTTNPTSKLTVEGDGYFSGVVTATQFTGDLTGTASTATGVSTSININTTGIITSFGGFISQEGVNPVTITISGSELIFTVSGIGSTSFTLS